MDPLTQLYIITFASVLSIRLHPRNDGDGPPDIAEAIRIAKLAATAATEEDH